MAILQKEWFQKLQAEFRSYPFSFWRSCGAQEQALISCPRELELATEVRRSDPAWRCLQKRPSMQAELRIDPQTGPE